MSPILALDRSQLATLVAVLRAGSFDRAANLLHVTPSAVSQRIKQLEEHVGGVVLVRGAQTRATSLGELVYRHGLQIELLERELESSMGGGRPGGTSPAPSVQIAVNADSLATWITPALAAFTRATGTAIELFVDDQNHTTGWLRSGRVLGAITTDARAVQGCRVDALGVMRYRANASPAFARRFFGAGLTRASVSAAPLVAYDRKDLLHEQFLRALGWRDFPAPVHFLPSPLAIVQACLSGVGWSVNPEALVTTHIARRRLVDLAPGHSLGVDLYWQSWSIASRTLESLKDALRDEAARSLGTGDSA
jgi:LysR family transcriptional regulator (chromosome initiation inhibitor)